MKSTIIDRPRRWDTPFGEGQTNRVVDDLMHRQPFASMDEAAFPRAIPLRGILQNDCRLVEFEDGEIIIRQGDYGNSAFLLLDGTATVCLAPIPANLLGRMKPRRQTVWSALSQLWTNSPVPERRNYQREPSQRQWADGDATQTAFLHDVPRVIPGDRTLQLFCGELFGEISALTRTPRSATIVANGTASLLEIRWQGLREIMRYDDQLKQQIERLYREHSLTSHLREIDFLRELPAETIEQIAKATEFESFGSFDWQSQFARASRDDIAERILAEPVVVERGDYVNGLLLIRNGFARVCRQYERGFRTVAYLGKGGVFGLRELAHAWRTGLACPWQLSLRAVGYLDVLRIPSNVVFEQILPRLPKSILPAPLPSETRDDTSVSAAPERRMESRTQSVDTDLLEFLVERRLVNGTQAMVIDLDRCTRCDDCVRACAAAHDGNPRFVRDGVRHDQYLVASACMHCADPVCMIGCPTGAIGRDSVTGIVTINDNTCIGCSTCANSCPYSNIRMVEVNDSRGNPIVDSDKLLPIVKATKCDLCIEQLGGPACQRACPHDALVRIDLTTPEQIQALVGDR